MKSKKKSLEQVLEALGIDSTSLGIDEFDKCEEQQDGSDILEEYFGEDYIARQGYEMGVLFDLSIKKYTKEVFNENIKKDIFFLDDIELLKSIKSNISFLNEEHLASVIEQGKTKSLSYILQHRNFQNYNEYLDMKSLIVSMQVLTYADVDYYGIMNSAFPFEDNKDNIKKVFSNLIEEHKDDLKLLEKALSSKIVPISCFTSLLKISNKEKKETIFNFMLSSRAIEYKHSKNCFTGAFYDENQEYVQDCAELAEIISQDNDLEEASKNRFFSTVVIEEREQKSFHEIFTNPSGLSSSEEKVLLIDKLKIRKEHASLLLNFNKDFNNGVLSLGTNDLLVECLLSFKKVGVSYQSSFDVLDYMRFISEIRHNLGLLENPQFYINLNAHLEFRDAFCRNKFYQTSSAKYFPDQEDMDAYESRRILYNAFNNLKSRPSLPRLEREFSPVIEKIEYEKCLKEARKKQNRKEMYIMILFFLAGIPCVHWIRLFMEKP